MSDWASFEAAAIAAVTQALPAALRSGVPVNFAGAAREFGGVDGRLLLGVTSYVEEHVREATAFQEDDISSSNLVTLQISAESQHANPTLSARRLIEQIRLGLRKESVTTLFDAEGISLVEIPMAPRDVSYPDGGRMVSAYAFDVTLRCVFDLTPDPVEDAVGLIEHVAADAALLDANAAETDYSVAVDDPTPEP